MCYFVAHKHCRGLHIFLTSEACLILREYTKSGCGRRDIILKKTTQETKI